jgi:hypothetical protein
MTKAAATSPGAPSQLHIAATGGHGVSNTMHPH